jgi:hypothetical protein
LVAARKKLRKAEKKQKKAAARLRKATARTLVATAKGHAARTAKVRHAAPHPPEKGGRKPKHVPRKRARRVDTQSAEVTVAAPSASGSAPTSEVVGSIMPVDSSGQA